MAKKTQRFTTSAYDGPKDAELYTPKGYKLEGKVLSPLAEEMIYWAAHYIDKPEYWTRLANEENFWSCLKPELPGTKAKWPTDFMPLLKQINAEVEAEKEAKKQAKKAMTKAEKEAEEANKKALKEQYGTAVIDGKRVPLDGYQIEGPGIIITRGKDPRFGLWKYRVTRADVTLNIVGNYKPKNWPGKTESSNTSEWIYKYKVQLGPVGGPHSMVLNKKVCIGATTDIRQKNTENKFDTNRVVLQHWAEISKLIEDGLKSKDKITVEHAACAWLMQMTGIRVGNPRDLSKFADTKGATTLLGKNLKINGSIMNVNFLGKDSVPFNADVELDTPELLKAFNSLIKGAGLSGYVFPDVTSGSLKEFLEQVCEGITCKGMRTAKCNEVFANVLKNSKVTKDSSMAEKMKVIFQANLEVAKKLNHQKNVSKNYQAGEDRSKERVANQKEQLKTLKEKLAEKKAAQKDKKAKLKEKYSGAELKERLNKIKEQEEKDAVRLEKKIASLDKAEFNLEKKKQTKDISLGTSLNNYVDLELLNSFCTEMEIPLEKIFTKTQLAKMDWCMNADPNLWRNYP